MPENSEKQFLLASEVTIDADFPGGNILLENLEHDRAIIRPDLRDTRTSWFYWYFRVRGAAGRNLTFQLPDDRCLSICGPAISEDGGDSWKWMGAGCMAGNTFQHRFPETGGDARFSMGMPYLESNLRRFLDRFNGSPHLAVETLCRSRKGRPVESLRLGRLDDGAGLKVALNARHHSCEMMAGYVLEGIMEFVLSDPDEGGWLRDHVQLWVVPFIDKDGVEDGDQGKNRRPHDHNRDYAHGLYPETKAVREIMTAWPESDLKMAISLHCPMLRGERQQNIYFVGPPNPYAWEQTGVFSDILESTGSAPLPFKAANNLPFGQGWNTAERFAGGLQSFGGWASELPGMTMAASIEIPYAMAGGVEVDARSARRFGHTMARALKRYLEGIKGA